MAQDNPYLIEEDNPYLNLSVEPVKEPVAPTPAPERPTPQQIERIADVSVTPPITGEGGAAFGMYPRPAAKRPTPAPAEAVKEPVPRLPETGMAAPAPRDFSVFRQALESITPKAKPSVTTPVEGEMGAAFGMYPKQPMGGRNIGITPKKAAETPEVLELATEYLKTRRPNVPLPKEPVKIMEEFKDSFHRRTFGKAAEAVWLENATPQQKELALQARDLAGRMSRRIEDTVFLEATDPINYAGGLIGGLAKQSMLKGTSLLKAKLVGAGTTAGVEGVVGGYQDILEQRQDIALGLQESLDYGRLAASVGASVLVEGAVYGGTIASGGKLTKERIEDFKAAYPKAEVDKATEEFKEKFIKKEKEITAPLYESAEARQAAREATFGEAAPMPDPYQAVMSKPIVDDIFKMTKELLVQNPDLRFKLEDVKTVDHIVSILSDATPDALQEAAKRAGVTPEKFLEMFKVQASEAGAFLQKNRALSSMLQSMMSGDPDLEKAFKDMLKATEGVDTWVSRGLNALRDITRFSVGASTAGWSTTVFNAIGLSGTVGLGTIGDTVEAVIRSSARMANDMKGGEIPVATGERIKYEAGQIFADSFSILNKMADAGYAADLAELALKNDPKSTAFLNNVSAEFDGKGKGRLNDIARTLNAANHSLDMLVRYPVVLHALKTRLREVGLDADAMIAQGTVPTSVSKLAIEDAQKMTLSYEFKKGTGGIEGFFETGAYGILKVARDYSGAEIAKNFLFPFARFMLNAVRYTYRLTPFSAGVSVKAGPIDFSTGGMGMLRQAAKLREEGKVIEAARLSYDGRRKIIDGMVGTAAIGTAIAFMDESVPFWQEQTNDGDLIDISGSFPYVNIKALAAGALFVKDVGAEYMYSLKYTPEERLKEAEKIKAKADALDANDPKRQELINAHERLAYGRFRNFDGKKFMEILFGAGRIAGTQKTIVDTVTEVFEDGISSSEKQRAGQLVGDFVSRMDNVLNPFYDLANVLMEQTQVVDPRATTGEETSPFFSQAARTILSRTPYKSEMGERPSLFQETQQRADPLSPQFFGVRIVPPTSVIEKELERLNIRPWSVVPTTGDRDYDNIRVAYARPIIKSVVEPLIQSEEYKQMSANTQQVALKTRINEAIQKTNAASKAYFLQTKGKGAVDALYMKAPNRQSQEDTLRQLKKMAPTEELSDEDKWIIINGSLNIGKTIGKFNKGGLATQTAQALSKRQ